MIYLQKKQQLKCTKDHQTIQGLPNYVFLTL